MKLAEEAEDSAEKDESMHVKYVIANCRRKRFILARHR